MEMNLFVCGLLLCSLVASESLGESAASNNRVGKTSHGGKADISNQVTYAEKTVEGDIGSHVQNNNNKERKDRNITVHWKCVQKPHFDDTETSSGESSSHSGESKNHSGESGSGSGESGSGSGESGSGSGESRLGSGNSELHTVRTTAPTRNKTMEPDIVVETAAVKVQTVKSVEALQAIQVITESNNVNSFIPEDATTSEKTDTSIENANEIVFVRTRETRKEKPREDELSNSDVVNRVIETTADTTPIPTTPNTTPISTTKDTTPISTTPDTTPVSSNPDTIPVSSTPDRAAAPDKKTWGPTTPYTTPDSTTQGSKLVIPDVKFSSKGDIATSINTPGEIKTPIPERNFNSVETINEQEDIKDGKNAPIEDGKKGRKAKNPRTKLTFTQSIIIGSACVVIPTVVLLIFVTHLLRKRTKVGVTSV